MRIAIPIWDHKISPVLDTASRLLIIDVEDKNEARRFEIYLDERDLSRRCIRIQRMEVDTLICGAISNAFERMLLASGVTVIQDISGHAEDVLTAHLNGNLHHSSFQMPGCRRRRSGNGKDRSSCKSSCGQRGKNDGNKRKH